MTQPQDDMKKVVERLSAVCARMILGASPENAVGESYASHKENCEDAFRDDLHQLLVEYEKDQVRFQLMNGVAESALDFAEGLRASAREALK